VVSGRDPFLRAILAAGVTHGVLIGAVLRSALSDEPSSLPAFETSSATLLEIEIGTEETIAGGISAQPDAFPHGAGAEPETPTGIEKGRATRAERPTLLHSRSSDSMDQKPSAEERRLSEIPRSKETEAASLTLEQLAIAGPQRLALRELPSLPVPHRQAEGARSPSANGVLKSMQQLAQDRDRKVGLGAGGTVASALESVIYQSSAAPEGQAVFEVVIIDNVVSGISLLTVQGGDPNDWTLVAKDAIARLASRRMRVSPGRRGVVLQIQVNSRIALPSGHDPGVEVTVGPFLVQRGQGPRSARLEFLVPAPRAPEETMETRGRSGGLPSPGGGLNLVSTDIDPVDLGAKGRRVVHAHTVEEKVLD
jgi:hypothetical protein